MWQASSVRSGGEGIVATKRKIPRVVIAGTKGGSGKTTVALGLVTAWRKKGLSVIPFKKGPDYIDAGWLSFAAGRPCYNLDPFLVSSENIRSSFVMHSTGVDIGVIEGNRGLYDGMDAAGTYSSAELAKMLAAPVILVLDCTKVTRTAGALLMGMQRFDRSVNIQGVILNQIAGVRHETVIRETIEKCCGIPVVGAIPKLPGGFVSERHMGLTPFQEHPEVEKAVSYAGEIALRYLELKKIMKIASAAPSLAITAEGIKAIGPVREQARPRIGVIRDAAFQFYYPENFEALEAMGANLVEFGALDQKHLPELDALYIGGGFPETHAIELARNASFRASLVSAIDQGLPVYAECGGLMYLGRALVLGRKSYPMAGVFPIRFSLEKRPQAHGYSMVKTVRTNPFYPKGTTIKGHEFHYSRVIQSTLGREMYYAFRMTRGQGIAQKLDGLCYRNVLATYTHVHALGTPEWAKGMIRQASGFRRRRGLLHE